MKKRLWFKRLHFLLALLSALPLLVLCISGSILVYREPIDEYFSKQYRRVEVRGERKSITELEGILKREMPQHEYAGVVLPPTKDIAYYFWIKNAPLWTVVYIDPYTGEIKGTRAWEDWTKANLIWWMTDIHMTFKWGRPGAYIVAFSSFLLILSLLSGLYLWWPKKKFDRGKFQPRLGKRWKQSAYNLHAVLGMYFSAILVLVCTTGIIITFWEPMQKFIHAVTLSPPPTKHPEEKADPGKPFLSTDELLARAEVFIKGAQNKPVDAQALSFPTAENAVAEVSFQGDPNLGAVEHSHVWVHGQSGEIVGSELASEFNRGQSAMAWVGTLHFGNWGALAGEWGDRLSRIIWLFAALMPLFLFITGVSFVRKSQWKKPFG